MQFSITCYTVNVVNSATEQIMTHRRWIFVDSTKNHFFYVLIVFTAPKKNIMIETNNYTPARFEMALM